MDDFADRIERAVHNIQSEREGVRGIESKPEEVAAATTIVSPYVPTLLLFGRILRNSEFDDLANKKQMLFEYITRHDKGIAHAADLVDKAISENAIGADMRANIPEKLLGDVENLVRMMGQMMYVGIASDAVSSKSLMRVIETVYADKLEKLTAGQEFFLVYFALQLRDSRALKLASKSLKRKNVTRHGLKLLVFRLGMKYLFGEYNINDERRLENLIADYNIVLGKLSRQTKGKIVQKIRSQREAPGDGRSGKSRSGKKREKRPRRGT